MKKLLQALGLLGFVATVGLQGMDGRKRLYSNSEDAAGFLAEELEALGWQDEGVVPCKRARGEFSSGQAAAEGAHGAVHQLPEGVELVAGDSIKILPRVTSGPISLMALGLPAETWRSCTIVAENSFPQHRLLF